MPIQQTLFDRVPVVGTGTGGSARSAVESQDSAADRLCRSSHPQTSRMAAEKLIDSGRLAGDAAEALGMVEDHPGYTAYELQALDQSGRPDRIRKRLGGLANKGLIYRGDPRRCRVRGSRCVTWWPRNQKGI